MKKIFTRCIDVIKKILLKNEKNRKTKVVNTEKSENRKIRFAKELRQYSEEIDFINEINSNPSKLFDMSEEELDNVLQVIKKRNVFLDQRTFELRQEFFKISKKDN